MHMHTNWPQQPIVSMFITFFRYIWSSIIRQFVRRVSILQIHQLSVQGQRRDTELLALKRVPRVRCLPLIGTLWDFIAAGGAPRLHAYIQRRHEQYGPIFAERLGGPSAPEMVFVASASLMRGVFLHEGRHPRHPLPDAWTLYNRAHNCRRGLFFMDGMEWLHNRRILNRFMLNSSLDWMDRRADQCARKLVNSWRDHVQQSPDGAHDVQDLESRLYRWAIDVVCTVMFDTDLDYPDELEVVVSDFARNVHKIFESSSALMSLPPQLARSLRLRQWTAFEANVGSVLSKGEKLIEMFLQFTMPQQQQQHAEQQQQPPPPPDKGSDALCSKLLAAGMPLDMVKRIFIDLVIAAGDTTAYTSEWALYLLARDKDLQHTLREEVHLAGAQPTRCVELVNGLIKETLRLYPAAPFIGRYLATDAALGGYAVKKDTLVLLSLYTAGRRAEHFSEPLAVRPQRWQRDKLTGELQGVLQPHGTLPFAIGNRSCIGRKLAMKQMHSLLVMIIDAFQLECRNTTAVDSVLRLVTVPSESLQLRIRLAK